MPIVFNDLTNGDATRFALGQARPVSSARPYTSAPAASSRTGTTRTRSGITTAGVQTFHYRSPNLIPLPATEIKRMQRARVREPPQIKPYERWRT